MAPLWPLPSTLPAHLLLGERRGPTPTPGLAEGLTRWFERIPESLCIIYEWNFFQDAHFPALTP